MKTVSIKECTIDTVQWQDSIFDLILDLQAETFLLRLMEDYGERCTGFTDEAKKRAYENIRSYQEQHVGEFSVTWFI
jgi:hypothetical protein